MLGAELKILSARPQILWAPTPKEYLTLQLQFNVTIYML